MMISSFRREADENWALLGLLSSE